MKDEIWVKEGEENDAIVIEGFEWEMGWNELNEMREKEKIQKNFFSKILKMKI